MNGTSISSEDFAKFQPVEQEKRLRMRKGGEENFKTQMASLEEPKESKEAMHY